MNKENILSELLYSLKDGILKNWYPLILDEESGGYFSNIGYDWKVLPEQDKMIVTQARHVWTLSKVTPFLDEKIFRDYAYHGYRFLKSKMWDNEYGGFYQMRNRAGEMSEYDGYFY